MIISQSKPEEAATKMSVHAGCQCAWRDLRLSGCVGTAEPLLEAKIRAISLLPTFGDQPGLKEIALPQRSSGPVGEQSARAEQALPALPVAYIGVRKLHHLVALSSKASQVN